MARIHRLWMTSLIAHIFQLVHEDKAAYKINYLFIFGLNALNQLLIQIQIISMLQMGYIGIRVFGYSCCLIHPINTC